ncbi:hypothetical protein D3C87_1701230 [compost metagenome]
MAQQAKQLIRTVATQDIGDVQSMDIGNCLTQNRCLPIGINFQMIGSCAKGFYRFRAWAERRFIGRKLVYLGHTRRMFLAWNISGNLQNARTRNGLAQLFMHGNDL